MPENDFFLIFSFVALYFHMGNNTHSERKAASIHTPALDIPGFCRNSCCHIAGAPGWFSHCNSVFSIHQCRMSRTPPLPCPMIRKIISGSFGESGLKPPQGPEGPQKEKPEPAAFHKTVRVQANPHEVDTEPPPGCHDISERGKNEEALTGTDV